MSELPTIVIGIPGTWPDRSAIVESIAKQSGGYLFAGTILVNIESKWPCQLEIYEHDPHLRKAFEIASSGGIEPPVLDQIEAHTFTLYLSCSGGSFENADSIMQAAVALLECGGLAVKVESTGIAHSAEQWRQLAETGSPAALMPAYVTYVGRNGSYYSCGMHNLGFRDTVVTADIQPNDAANLLFTLNSYIAFEGASINDGETFSVDAESPRFRVHKQPCDMYPQEDLFYNPYGIWSLTPA